MGCLRAVAPTAAVLMAMDVYAAVITLLGAVWSTRFAALWWRVRKKHGAVDPMALAHCLFFAVLAGIFLVLLVQLFAPAFVLPRFALRTALVAALATLEWNVRGRFL